MFKKPLQKLVNTLGYKIVPNIPHDLDEEFIVLYNKCKEYTSTTVERMYALYKATQYIVEQNIPGDIVECGVWKGGSSMLCALTLKQLGSEDKNIYMYDTYQGMPKASDNDIDYRGRKASNLQSGSTKINNNEWMFVPLNSVKENMLSTRYPDEKLVFVKGMVEETIPQVAPDKISLLRLDTDWYKSTYHELLHLFPRLSSSGVIIIDDFGYWEGAKEATIEYIKNNRTKILLNRIDQSGRIGIKPNS